MQRSVHITDVLKLALRNAPALHRVLSSTSRTEDSLTSTWHIFHPETAGPCVEQASWNSWSSQFVFASFSFVIGDGSGCCPENHNTDAIIPLFRFR